MTSSRGVSPQEQWTIPTDEIDEDLARIGSQAGEWHIKLNDRGEIIAINGLALEGSDGDGR